MAQAAVQQVPEGVEALVGNRVVAVEDLTLPWTTGTRTLLAHLENGAPVAVQTARDRGALRRRELLGRRLPQVAPWLPIAEVLGSDLDARIPFMVFRYIPGRSGRELMDDDDGGAVVGRAMGRLVRDVARVPTGGLELPLGWADTERLAAVGRRWVAVAAKTLGPSAGQRAADLVACVPDLLGGVSPVFSHGDFAPVNVVLRDDAVAALLDFERSCMAHPLYDAAWWCWIVRYHHTNRWDVAGATFLAEAGLDQSASTFARLNLLALLQCLEAFDASAVRPHQIRRDWADRLRAVLAWS